MSRWQPLRSRHLPQGRPWRQLDTNEAEQEHARVVGVNSVREFLPLLAIIGYCSYVRRCSLAIHGHAALFPIWQYSYLPAGRASDLAKAASDNARYRLAALQTRRKDLLREILEVLIGPHVPSDTIKWPRGARRSFRVEISRHF